MKCSPLDVMLEPDPFSNWKESRFVENNSCIMQSIIKYVRC